MDMEIDQELPNGSLFFVLSYLPLFELLAMTQVCKSFKDALNSDILPWLKIIVDEKLRPSRLTNAILMNITSKAMGRLSALVLIECANITDDGLQNVIARNLSINKLHVPQCTNITEEGIINAVATLTQHNSNLKTLKINGILITKEHLQTLHSLLNSNNDYSIDVEMCPICDEVRMLYNCRSEPCEIKRTMGTCRGCKFCVLGCGDCGKRVGVDDYDYDNDHEAAREDTFCEDCLVNDPECSFCNKPHCKNNNARNRCEACKKNDEI